MQIFKAPRGRGPYGIHVTPQGEVYYASLAGSYIARIDGASGSATVIEQTMLRFDPRTGKFESFKSSSPHPNVRQIHGCKGEVWTPESGADKIVVYRY